MPLIQRPMIESKPSRIFRSHFGSKIYIFFLKQNFYCVVHISQVSEELAEFKQTVARCLSQYLYSGTSEKDLIRMENTVQHPPNYLLIVLLSTPSLRTLFIVMKVHICSVSCTRIGKQRVYHVWTSIKVQMEPSISKTSHIHFFLLTRKAQDVKIIWKWRKFDGNRGFLKIKKVYRDTSKVQY